MNNIAIKINKLEKCFKDKAAVNKIDLEINKGEILALLGVNGAGKTTTIKMLSCLLKPTFGTAEILGYDINKDPLKVKQIINVSPQETAVAPNLTVRENLEFMAMIYGLSKKDAIKKADEIMEEYNLKSIANKKPKILSGGYQRRLSIALALISNPKVLFLDEPTLGLDVIAKRELWDTIKKLSDDITIILTTHYMEEAEMLSDRVAIMKDGIVIDVDTAKNFVKKTKSKTFEDAFVKVVSEAR